MTVLLPAALLRSAPRSLALPAMLTSEAGS
ncbi:hypothetical protein SAMN05892883_1728 [Jatrophihabitans sp. GAS493]|nr:hypothetical protein SAMN05892883_1728 [Jatrophihabitans sp. GAS493]